MLPQLSNIKYNFREIIKYTFKVSGLFRFNSRKYTEVIEVVASH